MTDLLSTISRLDPEAGKAAWHLAGLVGNTPLISLTKITRGLPPTVELYGKAEWFNPGGSVKDRAALRIILDGVRSGRLTRGQTLLDATSGNTGIGYAMIAAALGYRVRLCVPAQIGRERRVALEAYGAELILTDPLEGTDGAIREARRIRDAAPERYFYPDQYNNPSNWQAHYDTTGPEIHRQTGGRVTHFVAGLGTTGTFTGTGRRLKALNPSVHLTAFQPEGPIHGLEGLKHLPTALVPGIHDPLLADDNRTAATENAYAMIRRLAREEGLLVGVSAAAAVSVALDVARGLERGVVVTVLPDHASRYMNERFWDELR